MLVKKLFNHVHNDLQDLNTVNIDGERLYETPSGKYPSVTSVTGWKKQHFFAKWRRENPKEASRVTSRGNKLHSLIEDYVNNEFDPDLPIQNDKVMPDTLELFLQLKPELDKIDNVHAQEAALWSDTMKLAGRVDCVAEYDGKLSIIDFKGATRSKSKSQIENYFLQATAYAIMWQERTGIAVDNFAILISCEDGKVQVFEGNPLKYVSLLKDYIDEYNKHHPSL